MRTGCLLLFFLACSLHADTFRESWISVENNLPAKPRRLDSKDVLPKGSPAFHLELKRLHGGKQEGVDLLILDNGVLKIAIIPTRGMGVFDVKRGDLRLGWDSPVKEIVHPQFVDLTARGGLGWLSGFNEWMVRCGLENNGQAGTDKFINNVGDEAIMELTLHGKIANCPAQEVEILIQKEAPHRITVRGIVHERMLFGPKLELATEISTLPGSNEFQIKDVVTNRGAQEQEFQMLYHANYGRPILEAGASFLAPVSKVTPYNKNAARDGKTWNQYLAPTTGYVEQVYLLEPIADESGRTLILLQNKEKSKGTSIRYALKELPYLTLWKNTGAEADGYVTGLEPGTNYPNRRSVERKAGRVPKLAGGASYTMTLDFGIHENAGEVKRISDAIQKIQGNRTAELAKEPANP